MKKRKLFYIGLLFINFYVLPLFPRDTGSAVALLLGIMPLVTLIVSGFYGFRVGFRFLYGLLAVLLFFPTVFLYYNITAWPYPLIHGVIALFGSMVGSLFRKKEEH